MKETSVKNLLSGLQKNDIVHVKGWVRTFRANRFIALNDGSTIKNIQCVLDYEKFDESLLKRINTGTSLEISGSLIESLGSGQNFEISVSKFSILGDCDADSYPIQPKKHSFEFLRENAHLRTRTNTFSAVMRLRSNLSYAIHNYFNSKGFYYVHTPIITSSDAEGAGEQFKVTTLDLNNIPKNENKEIDYKTDFFAKETSLTVSGQLEAETYAMSLGKVYTFGPTFRAENSNTSRHLSEFWMIEPEVAFMDLTGNMDLAEDFLKYLLNYIIKNNYDDLEFLENRLINEEKSKAQILRSEMTLIEKIKFVINNDFKRITYTEAIEILIRSKPNKKKKFKYVITQWGADLQSEHERYLVEKHFKCPVIIYDYPANIKAFYMKLNEDEKTVKAMDILFPGIGEIVGGSQREERLEVLIEKMNKIGIDPKELSWYLDLRKYGTAEHSGFGLGFERLIMFATGMSNIRDVIPFPRTPQNASF
ncbi:MAG: asparagine--tRNA ligase [Flavobacteriaceae bacterium]|jgi:asparaginyl-tRNA synthetase|nr:asparagine--tRNA ligase [Flavobacteriaceae bacterium]